MTASMLRRWKVWRPPAGRRSGRSMRILLRFMAGWPAGRGPRATRKAGSVRLCIAQARSALILGKNGALRWHKAGALCYRSQLIHRISECLPHEPIAALSVFLLILMMCGPAWAQAAGKTVLDGVFTDTQAKRGETAYGMTCAGCHGEDLSGRAMGPLRGDRFLDRWREDSLDVLFTHIRTRMPANAAGSLSEAAYLDILAYILQANGFPAGPGELTAAAVANIRLV